MSNQRPKRKIPTNTSGWNVADVWEIVASAKQKMLREKKKESVVR